MKVFGKQGDSFIVSMTKDELLKIAYGKTHVEYDDGIKDKARELIKQCTLQETTVDISPVFAKMMRLHSTNLRDGSKGVIKLLLELADEMKPVENFINNLSE